MLVNNKKLEGRESGEGCHQKHPEDRRSPNVASDKIQPLAAHLNNKHSDDTKDNEAEKVS